MEGEDKRSERGSKRRRDRVRGKEGRRKIRTEIKGGRWKRKEMEKEEEEEQEKGKEEVDRGSGKGQRWRDEEGKEEMDGRGGKRRDVKGRRREGMKRERG